MINIEINGTIDFKTLSLIVPSNCPEINRGVPSYRIPKLTVHIDDRFKSTQKLPDGVHFNEVNVTTRCQGVDDSICSRCDLRILPKA